MAFTYNAQAYAAGAAGGNAVYNALVAAMVAQGWTLVHSNSTYDNVYQSPQYFAGVNIYCYVEVAWDGSTFLTATAMQDYDPTAFVNINPCSGNGWRAYGAAGTAYIRTNPLSCSLSDPINGQLYFGLYRRWANVWTGGCCLSTGAITASGTTVTTSTSMVGQLQVGQTCMIQNFAHNNASANKAHAELLTITAVTATSISFNATTNAYDSGAIIGNDLSMAVGDSSSAPSNNGTVFNGTFGCVLNSSAAYQSFPGGNMNASFVGAGPGVWGQSWYTATKRTAMVGCSFDDNNNSGLQGVAHHLYAVVGPGGGSGSTLASGTLFTDGVNVYQQVSAAGTAASPYYGAVCIGPTGATPNFSTMKECFTPVGFGSNNDDTASIQPAIPSPGASPINQFNQGLN